MLIYHYSPEVRSSLLTKSAPAGNRRPVKVLDITDLPYDQHISFFFDPIPSKTVASLFGDGHHAWFKGNRLIEHVVNTDVLDKDVIFHVVESVRKTALYDEFSKEHNWVKDDPKLLAMWFELIDSKMLEWGEIGASKELLLKQITLNKGKTEQLYKAARKRSDWETSKHRYASNVPHLMIYPKSGEIKVESRNVVVIGSDVRETISITPASFKW